MQVSTTAKFDFEWILISDSVTENGRIILIYNVNIKIALSTAEKINSSPSIKQAVFCYLLKYKNRQP